MTTRRDVLKYGSLAFGGFAMGGLGPVALADHHEDSSAGKLIHRAIPSSGQMLPIIGLGSSATFQRVAGSEDIAAVRNVLSTMVDMGGTVFDTAPSYGASEQVAGQVAKELGITDKLFWATKLNVAGYGGGKADEKAAREQLERSFEYVDKEVIDLVQIHNMGDLPTQLPILREYKQAGRIRYIGVTTTFQTQYEAFVQMMKDESLDFIGTDYAIDERHAEKSILPVARERGIGVLVYAPFGRSRLWSKVRGKAVPEWAKEFDATTWAQFFLKYVASHPDVTAITPATSKPVNMADNMRGGMGRLPDAAMRSKMVALIESL
ncbi:MAG: oxidoreductase [Pusillimonas sp.]|nr:oxidoreductase [Pusillimonas sp.]MBC41383.1 oxidoreductase [Pusillimonas sp.]HCP79935.1 aldo/keto reductase [Pusillimonas sp.]|tara:strand:- start:21644 stop:22606 length:963 start_codon:yes stop_codon:yes gene_type:complete